MSISITGIKIDKQTITGVKYAKFQIDGIKGNRLDVLFDAQPSVFNLLLENLDLFITEDGKYIILQ
jgi:hypothetical protein